MPRLARAHAASVHVGCTEQHRLLLIGEAGPEKSSMESAQSITHRFLGPRSVSLASVTVSCHCRAHCIDTTGDTSSAACLRNGKSIPLVVSSLLPEIQSINQFTRTKPVSPGRYLSFTQVLLTMCVCLPARGGDAEPGMSVWPATTGPLYGWPSG